MQNLVHRYYSKCMHTHACMHARAHTCTYTCLHTHTQRHTHNHTHTHTHTHTHRSAYTYTITHTDIIIHCACRFYAAEYNEKWWFCAAEYSEKWWFYPAEYSEKWWFCAAEYSEKRWFCAAEYSEKDDFVLQSTVKKMILCCRVQRPDVHSVLVAAVGLGPALPPFLGHVPSAVLSSLLSRLPLQRHVLWSVNAMSCGWLMPCSVVS